MRWKTQYLCWLASLVVIAGQQTLAPFTPVAEAFTKDTTNHMLTVAPGNNTTDDVRKAIDFLKARPDKDTHWILKFKPGKYYMTLPMYSIGLNNVDLLSDPSNPAQIIKAANFAKDLDYIFYTRMSHDIKVRGLEFYGKTTFKNNLNPVWTDQGIYFGSCRNVVIDNNKFYNFGNAAIRVTTSEADPTRGINSANTTVTNNTFNNVYQISTSSNDMIHGATNEYRLQDNTFVNLRGSVKFASRTPGAKGLHLIHNLINGGNHFGYEIDNYSNVEIKDNTLENITSVAINIYTAGDKDKITKGFPWGDNYTIANNTIKSVGRGIRFCHEPFFDGFQSVPRNLSISTNTLATVKDTDKAVAAISVIRGKVDGLQLHGNKMTSITSKNYISIIDGSSNVIASGNLAEGKNFLPKGAVAGSGGGAGGGGTTPPPSSGGGGSGGGIATTKPAAPSALSGKFDGKLSVLLTWKDNANNESGMELWGSTNGKTYSLIAKLYANTVRFTHKMKKLPTAPTFYYAVKAVNKVGPSALSNTIKVTFK